MITTTYIEHMGNDLTVANAARVSFGKTSEMEENTWGPPTLKAKDAKLIKYLAKHKHYSPFGHCFASFHVQLPVFVARQLVKHKFLRWNEISRRYTSENIKFYKPKVWRGKAVDKKQGSSGVVDLKTTDFNSNWGEDGEAILELFKKDTLTLYLQLLKAGVAPEQARMVLPQSTMTEVYWSGSLDAFSDMCNLRCKKDTQAETREVAQQIDRKMLELFPVSWDALTEEENND